MSMRPSVLELCAGGGGQALGLERAGFVHAALLDHDAHACGTLRANRPAWDVRTADVRAVDEGDFRGVDLLAAGVPCPPFSVAGAQRGPDDPRDLFPAALAWVAATRPRAVLFENVPGFASPRFETYRAGVLSALRREGLEVAFRILHARDFRCAQVRPRFVLVGLRPEAIGRFEWPSGEPERVTVAEALEDLMGARGWPGVGPWKARARDVGPTLVGGSKKHGGADLGPSRAKARWRELGVDGSGLADEAPGPQDPPEHMPRLTVRMAARLQGFPDTWRFIGGKTSAYRQIGNAFPPTVAEAVGNSIARALRVQE